MKKFITPIINKYYPPFINIYTIWILYLLYFATFRDASELQFEIKANPFETIKEYSFNVIQYDVWEFVQNIFGNIILFIPYGFLGVLYPKLKNGFWLMATFFIIINIVEFSQFYFKRGFADVDDIILNMLGVFIGFLMYKFIISDK